MNRPYEDLRFFIGTFFLLVGALLVIQGLRESVLIEGINVNLGVGGAFILFSILAFAMWSFATRRT